MTTPPTTVRLERGPCFGSCPVYVVTVDSGGRFTWVGEHWVPVVGEHHGEFDLELFDALIDLLDHYRFAEWDDEYTFEVTCAATTAITVDRNGRSKSVVQYATDEPKGFAAIAAFIDGMVAPCLWGIQSDLPVD